MRRIAIAAILLATTGCRETRPKWEVCVSVNVETSPSPETKATGTMTIRRQL
jgi:hypothetical protein